MYVVWRLYQHQQSTGLSFIHFAFESSFVMYDLIESTDLHITMGISSINGLLAGLMIYGVFYDRQAVMVPWLLWHIVSALNYERMLIKSTPSPVLTCTSLVWLLISWKIVCTYCIWMHPKKTLIARYFFSESDIIHTKYVRDCEKMGLISAI